MKTEAQKRARDNYDQRVFAYQTVKVKKELLQAFREACAARGDKVNTILRQAMERYVQEETGSPSSDAGKEG